jgi:hypothetical protein
MADGINFEGVNFGIMPQKDQRYNMSNQEMERYRSGITFNFSFGGKSKKYNDGIKVNGVETANLISTQTIVLVTLGFVAAVGILYAEADDGDAVVVSGYAGTKGVNVSYQETSEE